MCFDVALNPTGPGYNWVLGQCSSSQEYMGDGTYIEKCCVSNPEQILICKDQENKDWSNGAVVLMENNFCDDYAGYNSMLRLDISGISISTRIHSHLCI